MRIASFFVLLIQPYLIYFCEKQVAMILSYSGLNSGGLWAGNDGDIVIRGVTQDIRIRFTVSDQAGVRATFTERYTSVSGTVRVQRLGDVAKKYFEGKIENKNILEEVDSSYIEIVNSLEERVEKRMMKLEIGAALDEIFDTLRASNKYIDDTMPWSLAKEETKKERLETVLYNLLEGIRVCAVFLKPFLPDTSEEIFRQLQVQDSSFTFNQDHKYCVMDPTPIFMRIDSSKKLAEIAANKED